MKNENDLDLLHLALAFTV